MRRLWPFVGMYTLMTSKQTDETAMCYVNDEFGSAVTHWYVLFALNYCLPSTVCPQLFALNQHMSSDRPSPTAARKSVLKCKANPVDPT